MTARGSEEEAKRAGAKNNPKSPGEEQPEDGEEEKEAQVGGRARGAPGRANTAAINQGRGKSAHSRKAQEEENPEGHQRRPGKQTDPSRERQEKEAEGKKGQEPRRIATGREIRQGQVRGARTVSTVRANAPTQVAHEAIKKWKGEGPGSPSARVKGKKRPFGDKAQKQRKEGWVTTA